MKINKNQAGSAIIILLVILILAIVGFGGYYVWHTQHSKKTTTASTTVPSSTTTKSTAPATGAPDSTADWTTYTSAAGKFSVRYPASWVQPTHQDLCGDFLKRSLEIGPDTSSVIKCAADGTASQISVSSVDGDKRNDSGYVFDSAFNSDITKSSIIADGVTGTQTSVKTIHQQDNAGLGGFEDGTIQVQDIFYTKGITYVATYTQTPTGTTGISQGHRSIFDLLVTKTLKFN